MTNHQFNLDFLDKIDTPQKAYALGILQADGSFSCRTKDRSNYYRYKLSIQERDINVLYKLMRISEHNGKLTISKPRKEHWQNLCELSFNGIEFTKKLKDTFGGFTKNERSNIPDIDSELFRHYLRGLFDADGSFGDYQGVMLRLDGKQELLNKVTKRLDIMATVGKGNGANTFTLRFSGSRALKLADYMYGGLNADDVFIDRKYERFVDVMNSRSVPIKEVI